MYHHPKEGSSTSECRLKEYVYRYYDELKKGSPKVKISEVAYRCPYCSWKRKQDYRLGELLRHASRVAEDTQTNMKEKGKHLALERYINRYLDVNGQSDSTSKNKVQCPKVQSESADKIKVQRCIDRPESVHKAKVLMDRSDFSGKDKVQRAKYIDDQLFVWPWMGILANMKTEYKDGRHVGESGSKIREEFSERGWKPLKVSPLWNRWGHSGFAIVEFDKDWVGFSNGISFEKSFLAEHRGKLDYNLTRNRGEELYGWLAKEDDYHSNSLYGAHLRKNGDLKSVSSKEAEDQRKTNKLVSLLTNTVEQKNLCLEEMQIKYEETSLSVKKLMRQNDDMHNAYNEEIQHMQEKSRDCLKEIYLDHERVRLELEARKEELKEQERKLEQRAVHNDSERRKLQQEKEMNEKATLEQKKVDERMLQFVFEQKLAKEKHQRKILELEKKIDKKQALELEIERNRGALQVMKHMYDAENELKTKMKAIEEDLKEKEEELEDAEALNQVLLAKERETNDELQEARKALIEGLSEQSAQALIGIKRMGDLDGLPFISAVKKKYSKEEANVKAMELCSQWEDYLADPHWHPFKTIMYKNGNPKEIIDDEDEKLCNLKNDLGDEVHASVIKSLLELNEYNPSGRYTVRELWNFKEERRATMREGYAHLHRQLKVYSKKKR